MAKRNELQKLLEAIDAKIDALTETKQIITDTIATAEKVKARRKTGATSTRGKVVESGL
jgi:prefoldin subunit 5